MQLENKQVRHNVLRKIIAATALAAVTVVSPAWGAENSAATRVKGAIWANGEIYDTVGTVTEFTHPPEGSTDTLYNFMFSGLEGQRSVSEAAPGDRDFNGGRWAVVVVTFTEAGLMAHDPDGDGQVNFELKSEEDIVIHIGLGHLLVSDPVVYFECPLLPRDNQ